MYNSKLVNILKLFNQNEIKSFEKFILSPYFSVGRDVSGLFSELKKAYPDFTSPYIKKGEIYSNLFGKDEYNERRLKNLSASLTVMAEKFLIHNQIETDKLEYKIKLAEVYLQRGNDKLFLNTLKQKEDSYTGFILPEAEDYSEEKKILRLKEKYFISKNDFSHSIPLRLKHSENMILSYYIFYLKRMKDHIIFPIFYNIPFENSIFNAIKENTDFDNMINFLQEEKYPLTWVLQIYYYLYKSILLNKEKESEDYYFQLKELFYSNISSFTKSEKCYIFDAMATFCMMRDPLNSKFSRECFVVYKKMLEENAFKYNEFMPTTLYGNIMFWAYDLLEFDWLESFISEYSKELKPEHHEEMVTLAKAHLFFGKKDFEKSLFLISQVRNDFLLYKIQVRNLKFKIYYELNLIEQAYSLVDSFKHFLTDNTEIHGLFKERALDFINIYIKLLKAKTDKSRLDFDEIKFKIDNMQGYELRPWLLEKVEEFNKGA